MCQWNNLAPSRVMWPQKVWVSIWSIFKATCEFFIWGICKPSMNTVHQIARFKVYRHDIWYVWYDQDHPIWGHRHKSFTYMWSNMPETWCPKAQICISVLNLPTQQYQHTSTWYRVIILSQISGSKNSTREIYRWLSAGQHLIDCILAFSFFYYFFCF